MSIVTQTNNPHFISPPLALYIHMPWCVQKCPYCDFNSHQQNTDFDEYKYIESLLNDVEQSLPLVWGRSIHSIFIGGGTPSLFSGEAILYLFSKLRALLHLLPNIEITIEVNPNSAEQAHFKGYKKAGINRLSIGAQSFNSAHLQTLGRMHDSDEINAAVQHAQATGLHNINLDIMFGLPTQTQGEALDDLQKATGLQPAHLSWYQLTIEPNTAFHHKPPKQLPEHDALWELQEAGLVYLQKNGFNRYEVSAFAKDKQRCQHNLNYWQFGDYLGIGAGAHGKLSFHDKIIRTTKHRNPKEYLSHVDKTSNTTPIQNKDLPFEFMLNALRLNQGFDLKLFTERTGLSMQVIQDEISQALHEGFLSQTNNHIQPTEQGSRFVDTLVAKFL